LINPSVLDTVLYLFENYLEDCEEPPQRATLEDVLHSSGFPETTVRRALDWLEVLDAPGDELAAEAFTAGASRVFSTEECMRLTPEARGFLLYLEQIGVLDVVQRELVIERLLALDNDEVDAEEVQWVVLLSLFRRPGQEAAFAQMEDLLYAEMAEFAH
jgi:Smg protein